MAIPKVDIDDIVFESPHYNGDDSSLIMDAKRQHNPEFSQSSYLRLRSLEEAFATINYLDPKYKDEQLKKIKQKGKEMKPEKRQLTSHDRSFGM
jgi:hypothetical protein